MERAPVPGRYRPGERRSIVFDFLVVLTSLIGCGCWLALFWDVFLESSDE